MPLSSCYVNVRLLRIGLHLLHGALTAGLHFPRLPPTRRNQLKAAWSQRLLDLLNIRIDVAPDQLHTIDGGLLVANHISFIDVFVINAVLPAGFVAKSEVAGWPLIGWLSRRNETVFIERGHRHAAHRTQQALVAALADGARIAVFPEGTSTNGETVLPFHGALFQSAIDAAAPVYALALVYRHRDGRRASAPAYVDDISLLDCLRAVIAANGLVARIELAAQFVAPLPDRRQIAQCARQAIATTVATAT